MAWAQRSDAAASSLGTESKPFRHGSRNLHRAQKCAECTSLIAGDFTPQPTAWKCRHCDFRLVCDAAL